MKPVLYLDVDGVLLTFPPILEKNDLEARPGPLGMTPAPGARDFLKWALKHMEVRWLTAWAQGGDMLDRRAEMLGELLDIGPERLQQIPSLGWHHDSKPDGIFWVEHIVQERPFVWLDDDQMPRELTILEDQGLLEHFWHVDTIDDPLSLQRAWKRLQQHFELPRPSTFHQTR